MTSMAEIHGPGPTGETCRGCIWANTRAIDGKEETYCSLREVWVLPSDRACAGFRPNRDVAGELLESLKETANGHSVGVRANAHVHL